MKALWLGWLNRSSMEVTAVWLSARKRRDLTSWIDSVAGTGKGEYYGIIDTGSSVKAELAGLDDGTLVEDCIASVLRLPREVTCLSRYCMKNVIHFIIKECID